MFRCKGPAHLVSHLGEGLLEAAGISEQAGCGEQVRCLAVQRCQHPPPEAVEALRFD